ncbi:MAG: HAMP domain-containing sensor histidine kinase [Robiginitomaculum sp.]
MALLPYAGIAVVPAIFGLILWPFANREWVQVMVILLWIALAIVACFAIAFIPMAVLFLCAPAAAALFEREKVLEALTLSAIFAAVVFYASSLGYAPDNIANAEQINWGQMVGFVATIAFVLGALFAAAGRKARNALGDISKHYDILENYPGVALRFSKDGVLQKASRQARCMFGLEEIHIDNLDLVSLIVEDANSEVVLKTAFDKVRNNKQSERITLSAPTNIARGEGDVAQLDINMAPQDDGSVLLFAQDSSEIAQKLQALEAANAQADKQAAEKTLFFAGVSHELRTPLNAIIGFSDMMRSRLFGPLPGKYAEYADLIHDSGQHMLDLIGDVLDLSKVEAGKYELQYGQFDMADVVRSSIKMIRPAADAAELSIQVDIDNAQDLVMEADRRAIRQILLNLLSNAVKFTPKGGKIMVSAKEKSGLVSLSVEDNGMGISTKDIETIGMPYQQTSTARLVKARGSGLGLSLVKELVYLHKGRFSMNSRPGAGTRINISLPTQNPSET